MRAICVFATCLLLLVIPKAFSLELFVNGSPDKTFDSEELHSLSYQVVLPNSQRASGFSLDEILPLMTDIYQLGAGTVGGSYSFQDEFLAENLTDIFLYSRDDYWNLLFQGKLITQVTTISIWGERLADRELEVWVSWEGTDQLKEEIGHFAQRHGLTIKTTEVPKTSSKLLAVLRGGGRLPDVVMIQSDDVSGLAKAKALQSLDSLKIPNVTAKGREAFRWADKLWAIPFTFDVQLLFYNPDLVQLNDPKVTRGGKGSGWTLNELENAAENIHRRSSSGSERIVPMAWNVYSAYWFAAFQKGFGKANIIEPNGDVIIDDKATKEALGYLLDLSRRDLLEPMERDAMITYFATGRAGIILSGSYTIPHFTDLGIPFDVKAYPTHPENGEPVAPFLDFKGFSVSRKTRYPVLARRLIQHMTGAGVQLRFALSLSKMPARMDVWPVLEEVNPYFQALSESFEKGIVVPTAPSYVILKNTLWKLLRFVFSDQMTIDEALKQGQAIIDAQMKETNRKEE